MPARALRMRAVLTHTTCSVSALTILNLTTFRVTCLSSPEGSVSTAGHVWLVAEPGLGPRSCHTGAVFWAGREKGGRGGRGSRGWAELASFPGPQRQFILTVEKWRARRLDLRGAHSHSLASGVRAAAWGAQ